MKTCFQENGQYRAMPPRERERDGSTCGLFPNGRKEERERERDSPGERKKERERERDGHEII